MTLGEHQQLFARDLVKLFQKAWELGYEIRIGEILRPVEMQELYVKTGKSTTMKSQHLNKTAADLHFAKDGKISYPEELGRYWESLNTLNQAGMFWKSIKDGPHFQRTI